MSTLYTAPPGGRGPVHIVQESHRLTHCGRETQTGPLGSANTVTWPRWALAQADLTTRQRPICLDCRRSTTA